MCAESLLTPTHDIWKKGIPLKDAAYYFAPQFLRSQYNEPKLGPRKLDRGIELLVKSIDENKRQDFIKSYQPVQDFLDTNSARNSAELDMRNRLLVRLINNRLVAYGFSVPRKPANVREIIPPDLFKMKFVDWQNSNIKGAGLEFVSVLIFRPKWAQEIEVLLPKGAHRPIGRPSSKHAITEVIRSLIDEQAIPTQLRKNDYDLIRGRVNIQFPDQFLENKGLSDKAIAKYLSPEIARLKSAKKSPHKL